MNSFSSLKTLKNKFGKKKKRGSRLPRLLAKRPIFPSSKPNLALSSHPGPDWPNRPWRVRPSPLPFQSTTQARVAASSPFLPCEFVSVTVRQEPSSDFHGITTLPASPFHYHAHWETLAVVFVVLLDLAERSSFSCRCEVSSHLLGLSKAPWLVRSELLRPPTFSPVF